MNKAPYVIIETDPPYEKTENVFDAMLAVLGDPDDGAGLTDCRSRQADSRRDVWGCRRKEKNGANNLEEDDRDNRTGGTDYST